jgi:hypothetical protein
MSLLRLISSIRALQIPAAFGAAAVFALLAGTACAGGKARQPELHFVNSGLCVTGLERFGAIDSFAVFDGSEWEFPPFQFRQGYLKSGYSWSPSRTYRVELEGMAGGEKIAIDLERPSPLKPGLALVKTIDLNPHLGPAPAGDPEPTASALSPDGKWCAVGDASGRVTLFSLPGGLPASHAGRTGAYIRSLAITESGNRHYLIVGEQSPQGTVSAFLIHNNGGMELLWSYDTSKVIGSSTRDLSHPFGWSRLPGIFRIVPTQEGSAFVLATHPSGDGGAPLSALFRFFLDDGTLAWKWPDEKPLEALASWCDVDPGGKAVALCAYETDSGRGFVYLIDGPSGETVLSKEIKPLAPLVDSVNFWKSVAVSPDSQRVAVISDDGRGWLWHWPSDEFLPLTLGEPIDMAGTPLLISGAGVVATPEYAVFVTGTTFLPWKGPSPPGTPEPHPAARTVLQYGWNGRLLWSASVPSLAQGVVTSNDFEWLYICFADHPLFSPGGGSGLAVQRPRGGRHSLAAAFSVEGELIQGSPQISSDFLIVLVEKSRRDAGGERVMGSNALHVLQW